MACHYPGNGEDQSGYWAVSTGSFSVRDLLRQASHLLELRQSPAMVWFLFQCHVGDPKCGVGLGRCGTGG